MSDLFNKYSCDTNIKLKNFEKYVSRQAFARFLARYELFKMSKNIQGNIIECGVHHGGGLLAWAKLSVIFETFNFHKKIIGFDTFEGFNGYGENDVSLYDNKNLMEGAFDTGYDVYSELKECIEEFDENRFLNQFDKVRLIKGDATKTIPKYAEENKHLLISLLFLDFDLYEPTKVALEHFLPRMPKGSILAFDEINIENWPGETIALMEQFKTLNNVQIQKFDFEPNISFLII